MALVRPKLVGATEFLVVCCGLLALWHTTFGASLSSLEEESSAKPNDLKNDAIVRLSKVFGIDRLPIHRHHRSPPQYMVDLYNTVAYTDTGITKVASPYGSDVVRGFPDKGETNLYYNHSKIN